MTLAIDPVMLREPRLLVPKATPLGPVAVDWRHPLARSLVFAHVPTQRTELVGGREPTQVAFQTVPVAGQPMHLGNGTSGYINFNYGTGLVLTEFTVLVQININAASIGSAFQSRGPSSPYHGVEILIAKGGTPGLVTMRAGDALNSYQDPTISGVSYDTDHWVLGTWRPADGALIFLDSLANTATHPWTGTTSISLGTTFRLGISVMGTAFYTGCVGSAFFWTRRFWSVDIASVLADPYQFLIPA
jgi:hypothetical protein